MTTRTRAIAKTNHIMVRFSDEQIAQIELVMGELDTSLAGTVRYLTLRGLRAKGSHEVSSKGEV